MSGSIPKEESTETLVEDELFWKLVGNLPLRLSGIKATNFNDAVYAFGTFSVMKATLENTLSVT